jgi:aryl-alcohol dehydrogenase-like predicted oxidoreductase
VTGPSELKGHATAEGTRAFASRPHPDGAVVRSHFREFEGLTVSSLGIGTYLGEIDEATDRAVESAIVRSLASGAVNVVDTAINYRHQRAERSVGRALRSALRQSGVTREGLFLSTKNGYLAPDAESPLSPRSYIQQELIGTGALRPEDIVGGSHAMSVPYLRDQLARSLRNLGLATVDLLYLHNAAESQLPEVGRKVFFDRLRSAFEFYEEARRKGRLSFYGLATWGSLRAGRNDPEYLSLEEAVSVAREVGGEAHGLRFIQFPFNLMMAEAAQLRNQVVRGTRKTLLEAAHDLGVGTFSSVPLLQGQLTRGIPPLPKMSAGQTALQFARSAPHHLAPLVGQKGAEHVDENLAIASRPPLDAATFERLLP